MKTKNNFKNVTRKLAIVLALALVFTSVFSGSFVAKAEDGTTDSGVESATDGSSNDEGDVSTSENPDKDNEEIEKKLVQCDDEWTIFQYDDENGNPTKFDILYDGKTPEELKEEGIGIQYRTIWRNVNPIQLLWYSWNNLDEQITDDEILDIYDSTKNYLIEFRAINLNSIVEDNEEYEEDEEFDVLSVSDSFILYNNSSPYVMSSNPYCYEDYDLRTLPSSFTFTLKINEPLKEVNSLSVDILTQGLDNYLFPYSASNLSFKNHADNRTINGKEYILEYSTITFDVNLSPIYDSYESNTQFYFDYIIKFNGLEGLNSKLPLSDFIISVCTPTDVTSDIPVEEITINSPSSTILAGSSIRLSATVFPSNATIQSVTWSSSNTNYATVDSNGVVTAKSDGIGNTVTIYADADDESGVYGSYDLLITPIESGDQVYVKEIYIYSISGSIYAGSPTQLTVHVYPTYATDKTVTWSSSNTDYATVDSNGVVTAKEAGLGETVTITATANDGSGISGSYTLMILKAEPDEPSNPSQPQQPSEPSNPSQSEQTPQPSNPSPVQPIINNKVTGVKLSAESKTMAAGKKITVNAAITPSNVTNKSLSWSSSNTKYATVNSQGVVTAKKAGIGKTVTITATANDGSGKKATIKIKIVKTVKVSKIKLTGTKTVKAGKKVTLKATITPSNANKKALTWTSSNKKYATVNSKGVVTTKKAGKGKTVTITAKAKDGSGKKATIKIKIKK